MSPGDGRSPGATHPGATTDQTEGLPATLSAAEYTAVHSAVDCYSAASRLGCARYFLEPLIAQAREVRPLPAVGTPEWVVADPMTKYASTFDALLPYLEAQALSRLVSARNRREAREDRREFLVAQREASHAISKAVDWSAQSRRPSFADLQKRRAVVKVPR